MIWEGSSGVPVSALSLSQALNIMEPIAGLKLIKPARAGRELRHGACLLLLEVVEELHGLLFGVVEGHVQALMLPMIHSCDQHFLCTDHDVGLAGRHLGRTKLSAPTFTADVIFSLSFLIVRNILSGRLSTFLISAVNFPVSYLLNISIFCSRVIDFLAFFLPGASYSF